MPGSVLLLPAALTFLNEDASSSAPAQETAHSRLDVEDSDESCGWSTLGLEKQKVWLGSRWRLVRPYSAHCTVGLRVHQS
jgi:hypothetical protein